MLIYADLKVSDKATHVCEVYGEGAVLWRGLCATDPQAVVATLRRHLTGPS